MMKKLKMMTTVMISTWCLHDDDVDVHNVVGDDDDDFQEALMHIKKPLQRGALTNCPLFQ